MAKVQWAKGIDFVSGLLSARPKAGQQHSSHSNALLATHRKAATNSPVCTRIYMVGEYNRTAPMSSKELNLQARFTAVRLAVKARKRDLEHITQDQIDFIAQRDLANGKKTMNAYLWLVCGQEYDAAHPQG